MDWKTKYGVQWAFSPNRFNKKCVNCSKMPTIPFCSCPFTFATLPCKDLRTPCSAAQLNGFPTHSNRNFTPSSESSEGSEFSHTLYFFTLGFNSPYHETFLHTHARYSFSFAISSFFSICLVSNCL